MTPEPVDHRPDDEEPIVLCGCGGRPETPLAPSVLARLARKRQSRQGSLLVAGGTAIDLPPAA